jgi:hypothetical protein
MPPITWRDGGRAAVPRCSLCEKRHSAAVNELSRLCHQAVAEPRADLHKPNRPPTKTLVWPGQGRRSTALPWTSQRNPSCGPSVHQGSRPTVGDRHEQAHSSFGRIRLCRSRRRRSSRRFRSHQHKQLDRADAQGLRPYGSRVGRFLFIRPDGLYDRPGWRELWLRRSRVAGTGKVAARFAVGSAAFDKQNASGFSGSTPQIVANPAFLPPIGCDNSFAGLRLSPPRSLGRGGGWGSLEGAKRA